MEDIDPGPISLKTEAIGKTTILTSIECFKMIPQDVFTCRSVVERKEAIIWIVKQNVNAGIRCSYSIDTNDFTPRRFFDGPTTRIYEKLNSSTLEIIYGVSV